MPTTRTLLDRLKTDIALRRICGWERASDIPEEWIFSRAFAEFSASQLSERVHESFIKKHSKDEIVGHNSRDSTAIDAREKPLKKEKATQEPKKRGRPTKGEVRIKEPTRIEKQAVHILPHHDHQNTQTLDRGGSVDFKPRLWLIARIKICRCLRNPL
jgi:hypothetical protein